jgi:hypothetical protein
MSLILSGTDGLSDVDGSASTPAIRGTDTNTGIFFPAADTIAFAEGGAEVARFDSSGNFGVGTSSPFSASGQKSLSISGSDVSRIDFYNGATAISNIDCYSGGGTGLTLRNITSLPMLFNTNNTERMRIDSGGNLMIGTTNVAGNAGVGVKMGSDGADGFLQVVGSTSNNGNVTYRLYSTGAGAYRFYVGYGGLIYATSTSISALSDATLKTNVKDLETGLTEVMALKPRRFDWINGDATNVAGFVAQEVEEVLPELVSDYQYNETETKKSLKMGDILPTLVKAIQEQQAIITDLKSRIEALEAK